MQQLQELLQSEIEQVSGAGDADRTDPIIGKYGHIPSPLPGPGRPGW